MRDHHDPSRTHKPPPKKFVLDPAARPLAFLHQPAVQKFLYLLKRAGSQRPRVSGTRSQRQHMQHMGRNAWHAWHQRHGHVSSNEMWCGACFRLRRSRRERKDRKSGASCIMNVIMLGTHRRHRSGPETHRCARCVPGETTIRDW